MIQLILLGLDLIMCNIYNDFFSGCLPYSLVILLLINVPLHRQCGGFDNGPVQGRRMGARSSPDLSPGRTVTRQLTWRVTSAARYFSLMSSYYYLIYIPQRRPIRGALCIFSLPTSPEPTHLLVIPEQGSSTNVSCQTTRRPIEWLVDMTHS